MGNVLLTDYCNRHCDYCFASGKIDRTTGETVPSKGRSISMENLAKVVEFLKKNNPHGSFSALGGEPTLHPKFNEVIDYINDNGLNIKMFSNGIISDDKLAHIARKKKEQIHLIVNLNHPDESPKAQWEKTMKTFETIPDKVSVGFNIYKKDFDAEFLVDIINRYGLEKRVRLGLSQPVYGAKNEFIPIEEYVDISEKIVNLAKKCYASGIFVGLDCGFVLCMFTELQVGTLLCNGCRPTFQCDPIVDIGPDLDIWHCFPLSQVMNVKMTDYSDRQEIVDYYNSKTFAYRSIGAMDKCLGCAHLKNGLCRGGCLSHTMSAFKSNKQIGKSC